jgi:(p)ppGpp synthase/HD superfamily hydrolase
VTDRHDSTILRAARAAARWHEGQTRKYTGRPYVTHVARVAATAMIQPEATVEMVCAAWLHDVVEDCGVHVPQIEAEFGPDIARLVAELTCTAKTDRPELNRADRQKLDRQRLAAAGRAAKILKLIDRIDNLREIDAAPADFRGRYLAESRLLLDEALGGTSPQLEAELRAEIARHEELIGQSG